MIKNYNRRDFVSRLFGATVMSMAAPVILGELIPTLSAKAGVLSGIYSFKITDFPALTVGGLVWISVPNMPAPFKNKKVIVYRKSETEFISYSESCTHQGCSVGETNFNSTTKKHVCPCHGSQFSAEGLVTKGPATSDLNSFKTTNDGSRVNIEIPNLTTGVYNNSDGDNFISNVEEYDNTVSIKCRFVNGCEVKTTIYSIDGNVIKSKMETYNVPNELSTFKLDKPTLSGTYLFVIKSSLGIEDVRKFTIVK